jgi:surfeit locus 1 family protein
MDQASPGRRVLSITPRGIIGSVLVLIVAATCVRLGFWQLDRLHQKREHNARLQERMASAAVALASIPHDSTGWLDRIVRLSGVLDHERSIVLPGRAFRGTPGVHILTPLLVEGGAILVDRGWLPAADGATVDLDAIVPAPDLEATGVVLSFPGEEPGARRFEGTARLDRPSAGEFRRVWFEIDPTALRQQFPYPLAPFEVQLLPADGAPTYPVRMEMPLLDEGPHLGYAIQWFSFAAIAVGGWIAMVLKSGIVPA